MTAGVLKAEYSGNKLARAMEIDFCRDEMTKSDKNLYIF